LKEHNKNLFMRCCSLEYVIYLDFMNKNNVDEAKKNVVSGFSIKQTFVVVDVVMKKKPNRVNGII